MTQPYDDVWTRDAYLRTAVNFAAAVAQEVRRQQDAVFDATATLESTLRDDYDAFMARLRTRLRPRRGSRGSRNSSSSAAATTSATADAALTLSTLGVDVNLCGEVEEQLFLADQAKARGERAAALQRCYPLAFLDDDAESALSVYALLPLLQQHLARVVQQRSTHASSSSSLLLPLVRDTQTTTSRRRGHADAAATDMHDESDDSDASVQHDAPSKRAKVEVEQAMHDDVDNDNKHNNATAATRTTASATAMSAYFVPRLHAPPHNAVAMRTTTTTTPATHAAAAAAAATTTTGAVTDSYNDSNADADRAVPPWLRAAAASPYTLAFVAKAWQAAASRQRALLREREAYLRDELNAATTATAAAAAQSDKHDDDALSSSSLSTQDDVCNRNDSSSDDTSDDTSDDDSSSNSTTTTTTTTDAAATVQRVTQALAHVQDDVAAHEQCVTQQQLLLASLRAHGATSASTLATPSRAEVPRTASTSLSQRQQQQQQQQQRQQPSVTPLAMAAPQRPRTTVSHTCRARDNATRPARDERNDYTHFVTLPLPREDAHDADADVAWYGREVQRYLWPHDVEAHIAHSLHGRVRATKQSWRLRTHTPHSNVTQQRHHDNNNNNVARDGDGHSAHAPHLPRAATAVLLRIARRGEFVAYEATIARPTSS